MVGAIAWGEGMVVFFASRVSQEASSMVPMPATSKSKRFRKNFMKTFSPSTPACQTAMILRRPILLNSSLQIPVFF